MRGLRLKTVILAITMILVLGGTGVWAQGPPGEVAKKVIEQALDILNNPAYQGPGQKEHRRQLVKRAVDPHFDYREMARQTLEGTWSRLSNAQRDEFVRLFSELLESSYADKIEKYVKRVKIDYAGDIIDGDRAEVRTVVVRPNDRIPLNYRLVNVGGVWKVYDVVIEGVSLVSNYRSQFRRIIHESSYADLVRRLRTKVSELQQTG